MFCKHYFVDVNYIVVLLFYIDQSIFHIGEYLDPILDGTSPCRFLHLDALEFDLVLLVDATKDGMGHAFGLEDFVKLCSPL